MPPGDLTEAQARQAWEFSIKDFTPPLPPCLADVPPDRFTEFARYYCEDRESGEAHNYFGNGGCSDDYPDAIPAGDLRRRVRVAAARGSIAAVADVLARPESRHLLEYVVEDPFGAHVFPGDESGYAPSDFLADLDEQLAATAPIHLWFYIPTCAYRCRFCQYPVVLAKGANADDKAERWVDWNIREARLWLAAVPSLRHAPVGEFNVFGGTPSMLPRDAIRRLLEF